jgi:hypothetical protein
MIRDFTKDRLGSLNLHLATADLVSAKTPSAVSKLPQVLLS